jgi:copper chaperone CopZ
MIRFIVSKIEGVTDVEVNPVLQKATVTFDDSKVKVEDIIRQIQQGRYQVLGEPKFIK